MSVYVIIIMKYCLSFQFYMLNPNIFKAYDIRGLYPEEINEDAVREIIRAFIDFLNPKTIIIGSDARQSSPALKEAVIETFLMAGINVLDVGFCSTPLYYFAINSRGADGGVMITASHNPKEYNGLKLCRQQAIAIGGEDGGYAMRDKILAGEIKMVPRGEAGTLTKIDVFEDYLGATLSLIDVDAIKPFKVVVDCGNGMAGQEIKKLFEKIPGEMIELFFEPDGSFPNHEANPTKEENLAALRKKMDETDADLGIALDGDGDRVVFVDEKREPVRGDFITALIAQDLLVEKHGEKICFEVRSSRAVKEAIEQAGGVPVLVRPGHSLIKEAMRRESMLFGGELSGHYFYRQFGFIENALYTILLVLKIISDRDHSLAGAIAPLKKYALSGEINFTVQDPGKILTAVEQEFSDGQIKKIDGLTVEYPDWWFNLRRSNTEPLVRLNMEANTEKLLAEKLEIVKRMII